VGVCVGVVGYVMGGTLVGDGWAGCVAGGTAGLLGTLAMSTIPRDCSGFPLPCMKLSSIIAVFQHCNTVASGKAISRSTVRA
jgi:hypothetical protein